MPDVNIKVKNKIAVGDGTVIVCSNTDYTAVFDFDAEWDEYETKTARFISNGEYTDIVFTGNKCAIPAQQNTHGVQVGVFAGDLHTTTPAYFDCAKSILCDGGAPADPAPDVYNQLMKKLNGLEGVSEEQLAAAVAGYLAENPVNVPVQSVNGKTGAVELTASDVGAAGAIVNITNATNKTIFEAIHAMCASSSPYITVDYECQGDACSKGLIFFCPFKRFVGSGYIEYYGIAINKDGGNIYSYCSEKCFSDYILNLTEQLPCVTNVTITNDEDTDTYSADKTFEEIKTAYDAGQVLQANYDGALFALNWVAEDAASFGATYSADGATLQWDTIILSADGSIHFDTVEAEQPAALGITAATVGQTIKVKAVDDDGKPTEWEAVDMPNSATEEYVDNNVATLETRIAALETALAALSADNSTDNA